MPERPRPGITNGALDSRCWHQPKAERDDLPLFDLPTTPTVEHDDADAHERTTQ